MTSDNDENDNDEYLDVIDDDVALAPSLYTRRVYFRQARKWTKLYKTVTERYLRDDLGFGCHFTGGVSHRSDVDDIVGKPSVIGNVEELMACLQPCQPHAIVVCDANVLLHNMDVLEQSRRVMPNIIIPQTALEECRVHRRVAYDRAVDLLRAVGQGRCAIFFPDTYHVATATVDTKLHVTPNDENDERIRNTAKYFATRLRGTNVQVILLTDDVASRAKAPADVYRPMSVREWVRELENNNPNITLQDLVAQTSTSYFGRSDELQHFFSPHIETTALMQGIQTGRYHRGVFRAIDSKQAYITIRQGDERVAVTVQGELDRNRAVDGDVVAIVLHPLGKWIKPRIIQETKVSSSQKITGIASETAEPSEVNLINVPDSLIVDDTAEELRPTGKVIGIIRRNFENQSGSVFTKKRGEQVTEQERIATECERDHLDGTSTCVFFPVNKKIPPILLRTAQRDRLVGQRIVIAIDSWPANSRYPLGHYVRTIGPTGTKDVETQVLLHEHCIPHEPFSAAVLACLPPEDYKISTDNSPGRVDLRDLPVLSIDPPGCKDIDDALHCITLANGNYQVGVHIADVTHYVLPGSEMDLEAANRSTSTYLVNQRLDMLPGLLTTDLCSLKGNVDRYAFSVLWEVTPDAEILNVEFQKSIIHSIGALTYAQAQSFIDQPNDPNDIQACACKRLATLARKFRQRRIEAGALTLASPEVKFVLDSESLNPTDVQAYSLLEANSVVEEFMLLANVTVAKKILRHYPTLSVLRRHPAPNRAMFDDLISKAKTLKFTININDSKKLADSLDAAQLASDPYINKLLRILSTRCMSPAQYFCSGEFRPTEWHHYGLAAPVYTHFTSPIRRYADVCVHRLLAAAIGVSPLPQHMSSKSYLHDLCANMNRRHRAAQLAGRASVQLHTLIFFSGDGAKEETAYVLDVNTDEDSPPSFTVMVPRYGIEGRVLLDIPMQDPDLQRFPEEHRIVYHKGNGSSVMSIQVFDKVKVRIWVREVSDDQRELVLDLIHTEVEGLEGSRKRQSSEKCDVTKKQKGS